MPTELTSVLLDLSVVRQQMALGWHVSGVNNTPYTILLLVRGILSAICLHIAYLFISVRYWRFIASDESGMKKHLLRNIALVVGNNKVLAQMNSSYVIVRDFLLLLRSVFVQLLPFPLSDI